MILTPEALALLKRMEAEEALQKAFELGLEAAAKVCEETPVVTLGGFYDYDDGQRTLNNAADRIRALKDKQ